jgi:hypothetical protein
LPAAAKGTCPVSMIFKATFSISFPSHTRVGVGPRAIWYEVGYNRSANTIVVNVIIPPCNFFSVNMTEEHKEKKNRKSKIRAKLYIHILSKLPKKLIINAVIKNKDLFKYIISNR